MELPDNNIIETTLIGTGGGYGESVILHLGNQNWIIVDSCIDPDTKKCLPLEYLSSLGVNIKNDVKLILNRTSSLYTTSLPYYNKKGKPKKREKSIAKAINKFKPSLTEIRFNFGIVQCRIDANSQGNKWNVNLFENACKITEEILESN